MGLLFIGLYTSDGTGYGVRLRFRTAKDNAELVTVVTDSMKADMHKCFTEGRFDYYEVMLHYPECGTNYYFTVTGAEIDEGKRTAVYNKRGGDGRCCRIIITSISIRSSRRQTGRKVPFFIRFLQIGSVTETDK